MLFPNHSIDDYVVKNDATLPSMSAFTICSWSKFVYPNGTIVSYAVPGSYNEIAIWCYTNVVMISVKDKWKW